MTPAEKRAEGLRLIEEADAGTGSLTLIAPWGEGELRVDAVTPRPMTGRQVFEARRLKDPVEVDRHMLCCSTGLTVADLDRLDARDLRRIEEAVSDFL